jgi:hypothetical protein
MAREKPDTDTVQALKRWVLVIAAAEIALSFALGLLARAVMPGNVGRAIQWGLGFGGPAIAINYVLVQMKLDALLQREVRTLVAEELKRVRDVLTFFDAYFKIDNPEFLRFRDETMTAAVERLRGLTRGEAEVLGEGYYRWLKERLARNPQMVRAVSLRPLHVYSDDPRELNFIHQNGEAVKRGTKITRIFIVHQDELLARAQREILKAQCMGSQVTVYVVWKKDVPAPVLRDAEGGGFSIYDHAVVFFDRSYFERNVGATSSEPLMPRASLYCNPHQLFTKYVGVFEQLEDMVPPAAKGGPAAVYGLVLAALDGSLTKRYGDFESLKGQSTTLSGEDANALAEWTTLKEEIRAHTEGNKGRQAAS